MSKNGQAIMKGGNSFESTNDIATLREVGDSFCRTHSATREDKSKVHYHCDRVFDFLGKSTTNEGLHGRNDRKVPI